MALRLLPTAYLRMWANNSHRMTVLDVFKYLRALQVGVIKLLQAALVTLGGL